MPEKEYKKKLFCTTGKAYFFKYCSPKLKYIQDPSDFVDNNYKNDYSQFLIPYDVMSVKITPLWGPYSGKRISLTYDWDRVTVSINEQERESDVMSIEPGISPDRFIRLCLEVSHLGSASSAHGEFCLPSERFNQPLSLVTHCLRSAFHIQQSELLLKCLPKQLQSYFLSPSNIKVNLKLWPKYSTRTQRIKINAHRDMVVAELYWIVRSVLKLDCQTTIKLYQNFVPLVNQDILTDNDIVHCAIIQDKEKMLTFNKTYVLNKVGHKTFEISGKEVLVVSLMGKATKEILVSISDTLTSLDMAIRKAFQLHPSTFLAFKSPTQERFILQASKVIKSHIDEERVKAFLKNKRRNFPCNGTTGMPMKRLYKDSPFYHKSLQALGFYPGCFVEVFEVTGPTLPIMLFSKEVESHALDVNPKWPLNVFLHYIRLCTGCGDKIFSIDCIRHLKNKTVQDVLEVSSSLCPPTKSSAPVQYVKVRI